METEFYLQFKPIFYLFSNQCTVQISNCNYPLFYIMHCPNSDNKRYAWWVVFFPNHKGTLCINAQTSCRLQKDLSTLQKPVDICIIFLIYNCVALFLLVISKLLAHFSTSVFFRIYFFI